MGKYVKPKQRTSIPGVTDLDCIFSKFYEVVHHHIWCTSKHVLVCQRASVQACTSTSHAEIEQAIEDISNDSIVYDNKKHSVSIVLDEVDLPDSIKSKMQIEFDEVTRLLNFKNKGYQMFRRWYIDGRL